mgnify:CR=1 FL=1
MPRVRVKYFGKVRSSTGKSEEEIDFSGNTINDLLKYLSEIYGQKFSKQIFAKDGKLANDIIILLNHKSVGDNLNIQLSDGDTISILPFVSGG